MRVVAVHLVLVLALALPLAGCGDGDETEAGPSKAATVALLRDLLAALEAQDYERAITYLVPYPDKTDEDAKKAVAVMFEERELTGPGIDRLAEKGEFGPIRALVEGAGGEIAAAAGVPVEDCFGLFAEPALAVVHWDGEVHKLVFVNDVVPVEAPGDAPPGAPPGMPPGMPPRPPDAPK